MLAMAHINLYLYNPHQASVSYPFSSTDADVDPDAWCGQRLWAFKTVDYELIPCFIPNKCDRYQEIDEYVATKRPFLVHILHLTIATFK